MSAPPPIPTLRIARPTLSLPKTLHFYEAALGLTLVASFDNHAGFDGRILAPLSPDPKVPAPWHLEFTYQHPVDSKEPQGAESVRAPTKDNLLVLYLPDRGEYEKRKARMEAHGYESVESANPYWEGCGTTFEDGEGWRVVLVRGGWSG